MVCACGKTALYRVGELGYCSEHRSEAVHRIGKMGNPRAKKRGREILVKEGPALVHIDKINPKQLKMLRREVLRCNPTPAEILLRKTLRDHLGTKGKYLFQAILYGYIPDFLYYKAKLIIEADGWHHYSPQGKKADDLRTAHLAKHGYAVMRFSNKEILDDPVSVVRQIFERQEKRLRLFV